MLTVLLLTGLSTAGEHRPLCDKVRAADLVYEMQYTQVGRYPKAHRAKQWAPPESELLKTAKTGRVVDVIKGDISTGDPWQEAFGIGFRISSSTQKWDTFFSQTRFSRVFFLAKTDSGYRPTGWAEDSAGCGSSDHWSWCEGFAAFKTAARACLKAPAP